MLLISSNWLDTKRSNCKIEMSFPQSLLTGQSSDSNAVSCLLLLRTSVSPASQVFWHQCWGARCVNGLMHCREPGKCRKSTPKMRKQLATWKHCRGWTKRYSGTRRSSRASDRDIFWLILFRGRISWPIWTTASALTTSRASSVLCHSAWSRFPVSSLSGCEPHWSASLACPQGQVHSRFPEGILWRAVILLGEHRQCAAPWADLSTGG